MQSASAGPAAAVPLVRGDARLGQAGGIGGKVQAFASLQHEIWMRSKETWVVGSALGGSAGRYISREPRLVARAPRGLETFSSATMPSAIGDGWRLLHSHR